MPPFGSEPGERQPPKNTFHKPVSHGLTKPIFGQEPAEQERSRAPTRSEKKRKPFEAEDAEAEMQEAFNKPSRFQAEVGETSSSTGDDGFEAPRADTVFSLGWQNVEQLLKGTFWKDNCDQPAVKVQKRIYDNSKRKENAQYARQSRQGAFKANGTDRQRLQQLFSQPACSCTLMHWKLCKLFV